LYDVSYQARIVGQDTNNFAAEGSLLVLIAAQIQEGYERRLVQLGRIQLIAADEINAEALTDQRGGHAKRISPVVPAGKKTDANRSRGAASRPFYRAIAAETDA
jgi:hypothetical protein